MTVEKITSAPLDFVSDPIFKQMKMTSDNLSTRVKSLFTTIPQSNDKLSHLNQLVLAINDFDDNLKAMISKFPDYYTNFYKQIDNLLTANSNFMAATLQEINNLNDTKGN